MISVLTAAAMSRVLSRVTHFDRQLVPEMSSSALTLLTALTRCWERVSADAGRKSSSSDDDVELIDRLLAGCESVINEACRSLESSLNSVCPPSQ